MSWLVLLEPLFIVVVVFGIGFWQLRELNKLRRERERREAGSTGSGPIDTAAGPSRPDETSR
ncbi:MAG: hypothetical protein RLO01_02905 [Thalassobaculaceae bacterium]